MKKFKFLLSAFMMFAMGAMLTGCSDDDKPDVPENPGGSTVVEDYHFDLWVALDRHGGMGRDVQTLVKSLSSLEADQPEITFVGDGTEVNSILSMETILKGPYYYQVPVAGNRFGKYVIEDNKIITIAERQMKTNTFSTRKYTHAWLDDTTLLIMAAAGDSKSIVWTKLNADEMTIIDEGTLDIPLPENATVFTTSGVLAYRKSDNRLFYFYYGKGSIQGGKNTRTTPFYTAVIKPENMKVESNTSCPIDCEMVGSAYGELLQKITFVADNNDLYLACYGDTDNGEKSYLLRIPANSTTFDPSYNGYPHEGKLVSIEYMGGNKVMAYAREDKIGTGIDSFSHYYTVIDLASGTSTPVMYEGKQLDYSSGRFSSRMTFVNGKAYIGVDAEDTNPVIYIYDAKTGLVTKGAEMASGYYFEQIRVVENLKK